MGCRQKDVRVLRRGHVTAPPARTCRALWTDREENAAVNAGKCFETVGSEKGNALVTRWFGHTGVAKAPDRVRSVDRSCGVEFKSSLYINNRQTDMQTEAYRK